MKKRIRGIILSAVLAFSVIPVMPAVHAADSSSTATATYNVALSSPSQARTIHIDLYEAQDVATLFNDENQGRTNKLVYDSSLETKALTRAKEIAVFFSSTRPGGDAALASYEKIVSGNNTTGLDIDDDTKVYSTGIGHVIYNGIDYWVQLYEEGTSSSAGIP